MSGFGWDVAQGDRGWKAEVKVSSYLAPLCSTSDWQEPRSLPAATGTVATWEAYFGLRVG